MGRGCGFGKPPAALRPLMLLILILIPLLPPRTTATPACLCQLRHNNRCRYEHKPPPVLRSGLEEVMAFDSHGFVDEEAEAFGGAVMALLGQKLQDVVLEFRIDSRCRSDGNNPSPRCAGLLF